MLLLRRISFFAIIWTLVVSCKREVVTAEICNKDFITSSYLVSATQAQQLMTNDSNLKIIHIGDEKAYNQEHIPNAINFWRPDFRSKVKSDISGLRCSRLELEDLLSGIGVDSTSVLLVYDNKGSVDAFRFTWVLDYYGFQNHKVINGGLNSWKKAGYPTTSDAPTISHTTKFVIDGPPDTALLATLQDVQLAIEDPNTIIVDTREPYEYLGQPFISKNKVLQFKKGAFASGAIPGAINLNWSILSDLADDHRIKCEKDLRFDLNKLGITPDKKVIVYCQSGSRSSHTAFVLRHILDYPNVKNYDGSWIEWSYEYIHNKSVERDQKTNPAEVIEMTKQLELSLNNN